MADIPDRSASANASDEVLHVSEYARRGVLAPLFEPVRLGALQLPNRFAMAPMTRSQSPGGIPAPETAAYYRRRAEGGTGLILTEGVAVPHPAAIGYSGVDVLAIPSLYGDEALAGWKQVVDEVHAAGGMIAPQLWHQGGMRMEGTGDWPEARTMRPSGHWGPLNGSRLVPQDYFEKASGDVPPMTEEDIADVIAAFRKAAASAKAIGFDAIAIHGAHGYLIDSFMWTETNARTDRWGGDAIGRSRLGAEIVRAIRAEVGPDMPIILRFSQWKLQDSDGRIANSPDELEALLGPLADAGVDMFDVSARDFDKPGFEGSPLSLAGWARKLSGRMSMAVGSIGLSRWLMDAAGGGAVPFHDNLGRLMDRFEAGEFDVAGVGRMLIAQADWVRRIKTGEPFRGYHVSQLKTLA